MRSQAIVGLGFITPLFIAYFIEGHFKLRFASDTGAASPNPAALRLGASMLRQRTFLAFVSAAVLYLNFIFIANMAVVTYVALTGGGIRPAVAVGAMGSG